MVKKEIEELIVLPAHTENDFMRPKTRLGADEGDVDKKLGMKQSLESLQYVRLVIVPS